MPFTAQPGAGIDQRCHTDQCQRCRLGGLPCQEHSITFSFITCRCHLSLLEAAAAAVCSAPCQGVVNLSNNHEQTPFVFSGIWEMCSRRGAALSTCAPLTVPPLTSPAQLPPHPCTSQASPSACPSPSASSLDSGPPVAHTHPLPMPWLLFVTLLSLPRHRGAPGTQLFLISCGVESALSLPCSAQPFSSCLTPAFPIN